MQIIQILNDFIKVLYSPEFENISLADFMLVRDGKMCYLGQVVEIVDDKFDHDKNIAKIKLMHTINALGEIVEYTRQLPNKHAEVLFANQREILNFVNQNKKTITIGEDAKNCRNFELNLNFFENNAVIFCDKINEYNYLTTHLARRLNPHKKVVVFDFTGGIEIPASQKIKAKIDFKLPLNSFVIDRIWEKILIGARVETQAIVDEIFNEVKNYAKLTKDGFIPFNHFIKVIAKQFKVTPIRELLLLKNRLIKYQQDEIFANRKADFKSALDIMNTSRTTVVDMSNIKNLWQKEFIEFILKSIKTDTFVFLRLNEVNYDAELIKYAINPKRQFKLIPAISHTFSKMPLVCENSYNYILTPSLNPKKDFGYFEEIISSLSKRNIMLIGDDTNNFAFIVKNIKIEDEILEIDNGGRFEAKVTLEGDVIKNKRVKEKIESLKEQKAKEIENIVDGFLYNKNADPQTTIQLKPEKITQEEIAEIHKEVIEEIQEEEKQAIEQTQDVVIETIENDFNIENIISEDELDFFDNQIDVQEEVVEEKIEEENIKPQETFSEDFLNTLDEINLENANIDTPKTVEQVEDTEDAEEIKTVEEVNKSEEEIDFSNSEMEDLVNESVEIAFDEMLNEEETQKENTETEVQNSASPELFDKEEDEFNILNEIENAKPQETNKEETQKEEKEAQEQLISDEEVEQFDLDSPLDDETIRYTNGYIEDYSTDNNEDKINYAEGEKVIHEKYGQGTIIQVVEYSNKTLLQIDFTQVGKRLLDPTISGIKKL